MLRSLSRILVPVDFSPPSLSALEYAAFLSQAYDASVDVLHVWGTPLPLRTQAELARAFAETEDGPILNRFLGYLERRGIRCRARLEPGDPASVILDVAEAGYDLIVMGSHGHTGLARLSDLILGSVTEKVVRRATCPVLTIRGDDKTPSLTAAEVLA